VFQVAGEYRTGVGSYLVPGDRKPRIRLQGGLSLGVDSVGLHFSKREEIVGSAERLKNSAMEGIVQAGILNLSLAHDMSG